MQENIIQYGQFQQFINDQTNQKISIVFPVKIGRWSNLKIVTNDDRHQAKRDNGAHHNFTAFV